MFRWRLEHFEQSRVAEAFTWVCGTSARLPAGCRSAYDACTWTPCTLDKEHHYECRSPRQARLSWRRRHLDSSCEPRSCKSSPPRFQAEGSIPALNNDKALLQPFRHITSSCEMDAPIVRATVQAAALSGFSNVLAQLIRCWREGVCLIHETPMINC